MAADPGLAEAVDQYASIRSNVVGSIEQEGLADRGLEEDLGLAGLN